MDSHLKRRIDLRRNPSSESLLRGRAFKQLRLSQAEDEEAQDVQMGEGMAIFQQLPRRIVLQEKGEPQREMASEMAAACRTGDEDRVRWLLERCGFDPNSIVEAVQPAPAAGQHAHRWTALLTACRYKQSGAARILLAYGADPNCRSGSSTPFRELLNGLWLRNLPSEEMVIDLLEAGADPLDGLYRHSMRLSDVLLDYKQAFPRALERLLEVEELSAQRRGWTK
ncbi:hypothetical protein PYCC9005_002455 [Savitreella phatthalungensis]